MQSEWEYALRRFPDDEDSNVEVELNNLGRAKWRLVLVDAGRFIFARECETESPIPGRPIKLGLDALSVRELLAVEQVSLGLPNYQIALKLKIQNQSVKNLIGGAMRKLNVENRTQLALRYFELTGK